MASPLRLALAASALAATALLAVGCTASPGSPVPTSSSTPDDSSTSPVGDDGFEAAWLDDGRMFAVVTWGSSTCVPMVDAITANGQSVSVTLVDGTDEETVCTADLAPRASVGALPEGVDPTQEVELIVTLGDVTDDIELEGSTALTGTPGESTDYAPSAGWYDDESLVLLTWGSSSCPPIVESIGESENGATVTFASEDRVCTMDMAPRATILSFGDDVEEDGFVLTLVGDNLDGTVDVIDN